MFDIPLPIYLYLSFVTMFAYHLFKIVKKINMQLKIKQYGEQHEPRLCSVRLVQSRDHHHQDEM
jgi:hypothetical protein